MKKPLEIFDTPEATGFSRVGDNKKPLRICNKTGVHTCRLGSIHLNEREAQILTEYLTTKDKEKEEEIKKLRYFVAKLYCSAGCDCCRDIPTWNATSAVLAIMLNIPAYKDGSGFDFYKVRDEALPTEDNN